MKKILLIILAVAIVIAGGVAFGVVWNSPENVAIRSVSDVFEEALSRDDTSAFSAIMNGGSVKFSLSEINYIANEEIEGDKDYCIWGEDGEEVSGKIYISPDELFIKDFNLVLPEIELAGEAYISDDLIYVKETENFDTALGIEIKNLKKHLEDSIFAWDSDSDYSLYEVMEEEEYEKLLEMLEMDDTSDIADDASALMEHIVKSAWDIVTANAEFNSETEEVLVGGHRTTARVITMTVEPDDIKLMLDEFFTEVLAEDKKIAEFINKYDNTLAKLDLYDTEEYSSFYDFYTEAVEALRVEGLYDICDELDYVDFDKFKVEIVTPVVSSDLLKLTLGYVYENQFTGEESDEEFFVLDFGPKGAKKSDDIRISVGEFNLRYLVSRDDEKSKISRLYVDGEKVLEYNYKKNSKEFDLSFFWTDYDYWGDEYTEEFKISGTLEETKNTYSIKVNKIGMYNYYYGELEEDETEEYSLDLKITVVVGDKMPAAPTKYTTIDNIYEEDIEEWIDILEDIEDGFDDEF